MVWSLWPHYNNQNAQGSCKFIIAAIETPSHQLERSIAASLFIDKGVPFGGRCHTLNSNLQETRQKNMTKRNGIIDTTQEFSDVYVYL